MAEQSVAGELYLEKVETFHARLAELTRQAKKPEKIDWINAGLQCLIDGQAYAPAVQPTPVSFADYRNIRGLIFIGPKEWEKAMISRDRKNRNPLGIDTNWCPQPEVPWTVDPIKKLVELCRTPEWNTTPILWLALPEVAGTPTSLVGQYSWWGVEHDSLGPGSVRADVFWSNWYHSRNESWKDQPAVTEPTWMIGYEHPRWMAGKNWSRQQEVATEHGMSIATVTQDALMLNLRLASAGKRLRSTTWSRTRTICDGYPLLVLSHGNGLVVRDYWNPGRAAGDLAASVQGMPLELGV